MRRALVVALVAGVLATLGTVAPAGAEADRPPVDRVLVISLPTVSWEDLDDIDLPHLEGLLDESAVADLSTRSVVRRTTPGDGYTTMGAGARARGANTVDGLAFDVGEQFSGYPVEEVFARRTGQEVTEGIVFLGLPQVVQANEDLPYDAEVGALGDALDEAGYSRAVIANADGSEQELDVEFGRAAAGGLMDSQGIVPGGRVGPQLLVEDPAAPFGQRLDDTKVLAAFDEAFVDQSVVMVEGSDLVRADAYRSRATKPQRERLRHQALQETDAMIGQLLERVDPERDAVLVVGPYHASSGVHLTIAAMRAPGVEPGLMRSAVTRRTGFVTLADVAPTILDLVGAERPERMEGRPFERTEQGGSAEDRRDFLVQANEEALFRDGLVAPVSTFFVLAQLVLWLLAVVALRRQRLRLRHVIEIAALSVLAMLPATYLAGFVDFATLGTGPYWLYLISSAAVIGVLVHQLRRRNPVDPLIAVLALIIGVLVVDILFRAPLQLNTTFGYTPTIAGRFAGLGNLAFAQLAASAVILAGLLAWRIGGRRGAWAGVAVLAVAVVVDGAPWWGADVGGVLSLVPAAGVTAMILLGWRVRVRTVVLWGLVGVVTMITVGLIDLARPEDSRTHLGRLFERIGDEGFSAFVTVVLRKIGANLSVLASSEWTLMVPVVFAFVLYLIWRAPGRLQRIQETIPTYRASLFGFTIAATLGFALNDSGIAIPGVMLGVLNAALVYLVLVTEDSEDSSAVVAASGSTPRSLTT